MFTLVSWASLGIAFTCAIVIAIDEIRHPIIREALRMLGVKARNLEITSMADIPAGTYQVAIAVTEFGSVLAASA